MIQSFSITTEQFKSNSLGSRERLRRKKRRLGLASSGRRQRFDLESRSAKVVDPATFFSDRQPMCWLVEAEIDCATYQARNLGRTSLNVDLHFEHDGSNGQFGHDAESPASTEGDPSPEEIIAEIRNCMEKADDPQPYGLETDGELANRLTQSVRRLVRANPSHALEFGFSSAIEMTLIALVRLQSEFTRKVGTHDRAKCGVSNENRLALPPDAEALLEKISFLTRQQGELAQSFGRFTHVTRLRKEHRGEERKRPAKTSKPVAPDRGRHGRGENGVNASRIGRLQEEPFRTGAIRPPVSAGKGRR